MAKSFDELIKRTVSPEVIKRAKRRARELRKEYLLAELRRACGKTQQEIADAMGIKQPSLSKLEKQSNMQFSTLRRLVSALGGELEVAAKFPKKKVRLYSYSL